MDPGVRAAGTAHRQLPVLLAVEVHEDRARDELRVEPVGPFEADFLGAVDSNGPFESLERCYSAAGTDSLLGRMLYLDWKFTLADNDLPKVRNTAEIADVAVQYPMLDDAVVELSIKIPDDDKIVGGNLRKFYKDALADFLPREIIAKAGGEARAALQRAVDWMFPMTLEWFGLPDTLKHHGGQLAYRLKGKTNDQLRQVWMSATVPLCEGIGIAVPAHHDAAAGQYVIDYPFPCQYDPQAKRWLFDQPLDWDQRHTLSVQAVVRDPGKWGFRMQWLYGSGFPFTPAFRNDRRPDPALENSRRQPSNSRLTIDGDKYYKVWGQNVTLFFDARNVLNTQNIATISVNGFPNPYINTAGDDYTIYYTETGRVGGAYLQDTNGDNVLDWVPVRDPRVLEEGRNVRIGISITF